LRRTEKLILKSKSDNTAMHRHTQAAGFSLSFQFCQKILHFPIWKSKTTNIKKVPENVADQQLIFNWSKCLQIYLNRCAQ